jgi:hypothetical protein
VPAVCSGFLLPVLILLAVSLSLRRLGDSQGRRRLAVLFRTLASVHKPFGARGRVASRLTRRHLKLLLFLFLTEVVCALAHIHAPRGICELTVPRLAYASPGGCFISTSSPRWRALLPLRMHRTVPLSFRRSATRAGVGDYPAFSSAPWSARAPALAHAPHGASELTAFRPPARASAANPPLLPFGGWRALLPLIKHPTALLRLRRFDLLRGRWRLLRLHFRSENGARSCPCSRTSRFL